MGQPDKFGWIKVSFDFRTALNPTVTLHSFTAFCAPNSTTQIENLNLFGLQPTLVKSNFMMKSDESDFELTILNQLGQLVYKELFKSAGHHLISTHNLPTGNYFVRYESEKGSQVIRIQKN